MKSRISFSFKTGTGKVLRIGDISYYLKLAIRGSTNTSTCKKELEREHLQMFMRLFSFKVNKNLPLRFL
jgi:hypothetical protein